MRFAYSSPFHFPEHRSRGLTLEQELPYPSNDDGNQAMETFRISRLRKRASGSHYEEGSFVAWDLLPVDRGSVMDLLSLGSRRPATLILTVKRPGKRPGNGGNSNIRKLRDPLSREGIMATTLNEYIRYFCTALTRLYISPAVSIKGKLPRDGDNSSP